MSVLSTEVPNLINGVSQQADDLRYASQAEEQINFYSSVAHGLSKRPPTKHLEKLYEPGVLTTDLQGNPQEFIKPILRDSTENHFMVARGGTSPTLDVFDIAGAAQTVNLDDPLDYLQTDTPGSSLKAITIADYTLILNTEVIPQMLPATTPATTPAALLFVKKVARKEDYEVKLYNDPAGLSPDYTFSVGPIDTNPDRDPPSGDAIAATQDDVAALLFAAFGTAGANSLYSFEHEDGVIYIKKNDDSDFKVEVRSQNSESFFAFKDEVQNFTLLPKKAYAGFKIKVKSDPEESEADYFVEYKASEDGAEGFTPGVWEETVAGGIEYQIDPSTMPHVLLSEGGGVFRFQQQAWNDREIGDDDSNRIPSFIGTTIRNLFFEKNRLSFLSDESKIQSENGEYFNFFRTTVIDLLDSDRIDITNNFEDISLLNHAVKTNGQTLFFSGKDQFISRSGDLLTPENASIDHLSSFESQQSVSPLSLGGSVFVPFKRGSFTGFYDYILEDSGNDFRATEITQHIPKYIEGDVQFLVGSEPENCLLVKTKGYDGLYCFRWFDQGNERLQAAWFKADFSSNPIRSAFVIESTCYLLCERSDGIFLESMSLIPNVNQGELPFQVSVDRLVSNNDLTISYDAGEDQTTFTLPYVPSVTIQGVMGGDEWLYYENEDDIVYFEDSATPITLLEASDGTAFPGLGEGIPIVSQAGADVVVQGDYTGLPVVFGTQVQATYDFTKPSVRSQGKVLNTQRMQIRQGQTAFDNSISFSMKVQAKGGREYTYSWSPSDLEPRLEPADGLFKFPVRSASTDAAIQIQNHTPFPSNFINADWDFDSRDKRRRLG